MFGIRLNFCWRITGYFQSMTCQKHLLGEFTGLVSHRIHVSPTLANKVLKSTSPWILWVRDSDSSSSCTFPVTWMASHSDRLPTYTDAFGALTMVNGSIEWFLVFLWNLWWSLNLRCRFVQNLGSSRRLRTVGDQKHPGKSSEFFGAGRDMNDIINNMRVLAHLLGHSFNSACNDKNGPGTPDSWLHVKQHTEAKHHLLLLDSFRV